jgi:hypothetical protein
MDEYLVEDVLIALHNAQAMPEDPATLLPDVPDAVLPAQEILCLLSGWMEQVEKWSELVQDVDGYVTRLAELAPTAVPHVVLGL